MRKIKLKSERQETRVQVMMTEKEYAEICAAAKKNGAGVSTWMRLMVLEKARKENVK